MTGADDDVVELDQHFEAVLLGQAPGPDAPAWCFDLARLVNGARAAASPAELAAEDQVVAHMVELRRASVAAATAPSPGATAPAGVDGTADRATAQVAALEPTPRRSAHSPRHARSRAKHAAPRPAGAGSSTARGVGRLIAFKAAAVTTGVVVGTVAAAAATTGIVANVVVPAIVHQTPGAPSLTQPLDPSAQASGGGYVEDEDEPQVTVAVPTCQLTPVCSPLTPANPSTDPVPSRPTGPTVPTTERPRSETESETPSTSTSTSTTEVTTDPSEPDPGSTTSTETTTTTEPSPATPFSLPAEPAPAPTEP